MIEKPFTLDGSDKDPDSEFSLESEELRRLYVETESAWHALGKFGFECQRAE